MAKTDLEKLQEALEAGDQEAAKTLTKKIARATKRAARPARVGPSGDGGGGCPPAVEAEDPTSSWMVPARGRGGDPSKNYGRTASMQGHKFVNTFKDDGKGVLDGGMRDVEEQLARQAATPRPGTKGAAREAVRKFRVVCDGPCGRPFEVYGSQMTVSHDDGGRASRVYRCDRCARRGG